VALPRFFSNIITTICVLYHSQWPTQNTVHTHGCQGPHRPSTFSKTVFTTHSPRRHHRPASHGVPSAHGIYCVRQPDCSPRSVVHHSCLHTGYKKRRTLSLTGKTYTNLFCLLVNISNIENCTIHHIIHSLYQGIPNLLINIRFQSICVNVISFKPIKKVWPSVCQRSWNS